MGVLLKRRSSMESYSTSMGDPLELTDLDDLRVESEPTSLGLGPQVNYLYETCVD